MTKLPSFSKKTVVIFFLTLTAILGWVTVTAGYILTTREQSKSQARISQLETDYATLQQNFDALKNEDQIKKNLDLQTEITNINTTYKKTIAAYESMLRLKEDAGKNQTLESLFSKTVVALASRKYDDAKTSLSELEQEIQKAIAAQAQAEPPIPANVPSIQEAPGSGYQRQSVTTSVGTFLVDVIAADLNSTRVQVETASEGTCTDNCPVASLADYVARSGGFAGINGPYFCPAEYPSCAGKTNSFDTLLMNKNKVYFNSENNVYSTVPAVSFSGSSANYTSSQNMGRDTGPDAIIAAQPMLVSGGQITFGGDGDPKKGSRGSRSFIGTKGSTVYIGVVRGATVAEVAYVLQTMGIEYALNLDSGGSTALYHQGRYLAGPGRQTPFGIILVQK